MGFQSIWKISSGDDGDDDDGGGERIRGGKGVPDERKDERTHSGEQQHSLYVTNRPLRYYVSLIAARDERRRFRLKVISCHPNLIYSQYSLPHCAAFIFRVY